MVNEEDEILLGGAFLTKALLPGVERVVSSMVVMAALDTLILFECWFSCFFLASRSGVLVEVEFECFL